MDERFCCSLLFAKFRLSRDAVADGDVRPGASLQLSNLARSRSSRSRSSTCSRCRSSNCWRSFRASQLLLPARSSWAMSARWRARCRSPCDTCRHAWVRCARTVARSMRDYSARRTDCPVPLPRARPFHTRPTREAIALDTAGLSAPTESGFCVRTCPAVALPGRWHYGNMRRLSNERRETPGHKGVPIKEAEEKGWRYRVSTMSTLPPRLEFLNDQQAGDP